MIQVTDEMVSAAAGEAAEHWHTPNGPCCCGHPIDDFIDQARHTMRRALEAALSAAPLGQTGEQPDA